MNEIKATKEYIQTLKQVYNEKGLGAVFKHELKSNQGTFHESMGKLGNYLLAVFYEDGVFMPLRDVIEHNKKIDERRHKNILNQKLIEGSWDYSLIGSMA
ncbi:hypothetical protein H8D91_00815 [archaeon]|nr:hypothetical protein [archaeon]